MPRFFALLALLFVTPLLAVDVTKITAETPQGSRTVPMTPTVVAAVKTALEATPTQPTTVPASQPSVVLTGILRYSGNAWAAGWQLPLDDAGWVAWPRKADCRDVYVSPRGVDTATGSQTAPLKTFSRAVKVVAANPQQQFTIWLEAGGSFDAVAGNLPIGSKSYPNVIRSWGSGRASVESVSLSGRGGIALVDLSIVNTKPIKGTTIGLFVYNCSSVWIEGCDVASWSTGVVAEAADDKWQSDIVIRRTVIRDNYPDKGNTFHSQGLYVFHTDGLLLDEVVLDANGYKVGYSNATMFNQNGYVHAENRNVVVRFLWSSNAGAAGLQARSGGLVQYGLFVNNPNGLCYGLVNGGGKLYPGGVFGEVTNTVIQRCPTVNNVGAGNALSLSNVHGVTVSDVILQEAAGTAVSFERCSGTFQDTSVGIHDVSLRRLYTWKCTAGVKSDFAFSNLPYIAGGSRNSWQNVKLADSSVSFDAAGPFAKLVVPPVPMAEKYTQPRNLDDYARSIGMAGQADVLRIARSQSRWTWDNRASPRYVIPWIQAGFKPAP